MIIFLTSSSVQLLSEKLAALIAAFKAKAGPDATVVKRSVERETNFISIRDVIGTTSLFSKKKLVILRDAIQELRVAEQDRMVAYLKEHKVPESTTLVIVSGEPLPPATKNRLVAYLSKSKTIKKISVEVPSGKKGVDELIERAKKLGAVLSPAVARELLQRVGDDYDRVLHELTKLSLFAASRKDTKISSADVRETVNETLENDIFKTIGALGERDLPKALSLLHRHLEQGAHPLYLLTMMRYQFRTLALVRDAAQESSDPRTIAGNTKLSFYVVQKTLAQLANFKQRNPQQIFRRLVDADEAIKTARIDGDVALDLLAVAICR
jgi:DNA polymerase-3 subunit delta